MLFFSNSRATMQSPAQVYHHTRNFPPPFFNSHTLLEADYLLRGVYSDLKKLNIKYFWFGLSGNLKVKAPLHERFLKTSCNIYWYKLFDRKQVLSGSPSPSQLDMESIKLIFVYFAYLFKINNFLETFIYLQSDPKKVTLKQKISSYRFLGVNVVVSLFYRRFLGGRPKK